MLRLATVPPVTITLDEAVKMAATGDIWLFRGRKAADRAIQVATNSPVNHAGMVVALDDLPPLMWHAELGRSLPDLWSGSRHRGVQLHDLRDAVIVWATRYGQRAWLRQLSQPISREMEDAVLRTIARLDGTPFPSTARLATRWLASRGAGRRRGSASPGREAAGAPRSWRGPALRSRARAEEAALETAYCAEVLAITYQAMGLLPGHRHASWYDPGRFWSGDDLRLAAGFELGGEIPVVIPPGVKPAAAGTA